MVANYYKNARNIPATNVVELNDLISHDITIDGVTHPVIIAEGGNIIRDSLYHEWGAWFVTQHAWKYFYQYVALPIKNYITSNNLTSIRYIVLCKGVPFKIQAGGDFGSVIGNIAVDGLLSMLNTNNYDVLLNSIYNRYRSYALPDPNYCYSCQPQITNPYYNADPNLNMSNRFLPGAFTRNWNGHTIKLDYLISHLDGISYNMVKEIIDLSSEAPHADNYDWFIDADPQPCHGGTIMVDFANSTAAKLNSLGFSNYSFDVTEDTVTHHNKPIISYSSNGVHTTKPPNTFEGQTLHPDYIQTQLNFTYVPGAIFNTAESFNAHSLSAISRRPGAEMGQLVEFFLKGGTVSVGHAYEPYVPGVVNDGMMLPSYQLGYSFIDAAYMGMQYLAWQNVVVGDPLTTIAWGKQTLTENKTLTGTNLVTGVITVPSGKTLTIAANAVINFKYSGSLVVNGNLTIQQGAKLNFLNGASLIVNGALNANGTTTNKITFDFSSPNSTTQNGIKFNSGSSGTINYAIVKNGYYGVSVTGNPTGTINITNSAISTSSYAVYISGNTSSNVNITGCDIGTSSGGINLNSAVANIDGCTIHNITTYGGGAVVFNNSGGTIKNCNIQNNSIATNGISILNNSSPYVFQNTIANNTLNGVYVLQASPSLQSNAISTTGYGHAAVSNNSYSHTLFGKTSYPFDGYNTISGSYYGIYVGDHSLIQAGYSDIARYNRILGNTYNTYVTGTSTLYAKNDWWGAYQPDTTKFYKEAGSYFYYLPYLTTDPSGSQSIVSSRGLSASADAVSTGAAYTQEEELLLKAKELQEKDQLSEAIDIYKELIKTNSEKSIAEIALLELNNIYRNTKDKNIKEYFKEFKLSQNNQKRLYPIALVILSLNNKREKNFTESLDDCETLIKEFSSTEHEKNALMNKFFLYYDNNDFTSAKTVVEKLANSFAESPEVGTAINLLSMQTIENEKMLPKMKAVDNTVTENLPESYELNNYPNPFNPVTTIAYQLPKEGFVTIRVFDILGKEVKTLVNEYKEIGNYTVPFDASTLTSGMYIYQLQVNDYTSTKKMLLLK